LGNPALGPQRAKNWDFSLEYYFEPSSSFSVGWFHKTITDFILSGREIGIVPDGTDNGFNGDYSGYRILSTINAGTAIAQGWEFSYLQQFRFMPGLLKTLRFSANFTMINAHGDYGGTTYLKNSQVNGFIPRTGNASLSWDYRKFGVSMSYNYTSESIRTAFNVAQPSRNQYLKARELVNLNMRYQLPRNLTLNFGVANLFNEPQIYYRGFADRLETFLIQGTTITAGLEGRF
jgi:TonB-dependent receptor